MSGPTASNHLDVCGSVVAICMRNTLKDKYIFYAELLQLHIEGEKLHPTSYQGCSNAKGEEQNEISRDPLGDVLL
jgi:hypothetical protein